MNKTRQELVTDMAQAHRQAMALVVARTRVSTGHLKESVTGHADLGTDVLKISFGWEGFQPYYAPFQEFGTRNGIKPMMAVFNAFNQVSAGLAIRLKRR